MSTCEWKYNTSDSFAGFSHQRPKNQVLWILVMVSAKIIRKFLGRFKSMSKCYVKTANHAFLKFKKLHKYQDYYIGHMCSFITCFLWILYFARVAVISALCNRGCCSTFTSLCLALMCHRQRNFNKLCSLVLFFIWKWRQSSQSLMQKA